MMCTQVTHSGCRQLLSEDLADRQSYGGVRVINPFRKLE